MYVMFIIHDHLQSLQYCSYLEPKLNYFYCISSCIFNTPGSYIRVKDLSRSTVGAVNQRIVRGQMLC